MQEVSCNGDCLCFPRYIAVQVSADGIRSRRDQGNSTAKDIDFAGNVPRTLSCFCRCVMRGYYFFICSPFCTGIVLLPMLWWRGRRSS